MATTLITGGARSGKSRLAQSIGEGSLLPVTFVATATAGDEDMSQRIAAHRAGRPGSWATIEAPLDIEESLGKVDPSGMVIVDCLTLWTSNLMMEGEDETAIRDRAESLARYLTAFTSVVVVTNEVGLGIVPDNALARVYRDILGRVNATFADAFDQVLLAVAGRVVPAVRW